ncbi:hypothetical protein LQV05_000844 [Cryptococcus neoformans]|nr:hypothetical protein LQV05_000844 [Cryptococcus neoformans]
MFANSLRHGLRTASRSSARAFSTIPARAPRTNVVGALALGTAVAGYALYESTRSPVLLEGPRTIAGEKGTVTERSFVMAHVCIKSLTPSDALAKEHYADLSARPFYPSLVKYITSGTPVVAMVWEGKDVIRQGRRIVGATNPLDADAGSVRGQYAVSVGRNLIHASDAFESATKEIGLWFAPEELSEYEPVAWPWVMADN